MPSATPPAAAPLAGETVPILMHDLGGQVVADGTLVAFQTADKLFDGASATLHDDAPGRLMSLVRLIRQINPSGLLIAVRDDGDTDLAQRRAAILQTWFVETGQVRLPIRTANTGPAAIGVLILR